MCNNNRRVLVTGGAGFIGSHLTERLLKNGNEVIVLDNFSSGKPENLEHIRSNSRLTVHSVDITNHFEIRQFFNGVDWVFHLAALADIVPSVQKPLTYHNANVNGTISVLEAARMNGVKRFIYTASSSCYGIPDRFPTTETAPIRSMYPYALTKYIGEQYVLHWTQVYKLPCVSLRLFNVYGLRARTSGAYGAVFGVFLTQKLHGKPFTVVGDGNQTRDFIYVSDVVEAFVKAASSQVKNEIFNVGSGSPQSINKLVSLLKGEKVHIPKRPGEPDTTWADISKIKGLLDWLPQVSFEEGTRKLLENIAYWKDAPVWTPEKIEKATSEWFKCLT